MSWEGPPSPKDVADITATTIRTAVRLGWQTHICVTTSENSCHASSRQPQAVVVEDEEKRMEAARTQYPQVPATDHLAGARAEDEKLG